MSEITLKFAGKCGGCGGWMDAGTRAKWERGAGVRHVGECPKATPRGGAVAITSAGVFRKDGKIYVVKPNQEKTALYAKEIREINGARLTEAGERVDFEAVYAKGMVYNLTEADRWPLAEAAEFLTRYARCIVCGRGLKDAESVARGIGPVCAGYFAQ